MKKLNLAPGEHSCTWMIDGQKAPGTVTLESGQRPRAHASGLPERWRMVASRDDDSELPSYPHLEQLSEIRGRLLSGYEVVLLGVEVRHQFPGIASATADIALCGRDLPRGDELIPWSVEFQVGGLSEFAGVRPLEQISIDVPERGSATEYRVVWNPQARQSWTIPGYDQVDVDFVAHTKQDDSHSFAITPYPVVRVRGNRRSVRDWVTEYARPLMQLTTLATSHPQQISWMEVHGEDGQDRPWSAQVFAEDVLQQPYVASTGTTHAPTLLQLGAGGAVLPDLLARWGGLEQHCRSFFDYVTRALQTTMSTTTRLLFLVPALEALHTVDNPDLPASDSPYNRRRIELAQRVDSIDGLTPQDIADLKRVLPPRPRDYQLHERLRALAHSLPTQITRYIDRHIVPIPPLLGGIATNPVDAWQILATARNAIAHGDENQPSPEQLLALTRLAHTLAVALTVQYLGHPEALADALTQHDWPVL